MSDFKWLRDAGAGRTKGPWKWECHGIDMLRGDHGNVLIGEDLDLGKKDARFIAAAGTLWDKMVAVVEEADKWKQCTYVDYLEGCCPHIADCGDDVVKALNALQAARKEVE